MDQPDEHALSAPDPRPGDPEDHGVSSREPDAMQLEPAKLLANDARSELHARGFDDRDIDEWAKTYVDEVGAGDVPAFLAWIDARQSQEAADGADPSSSQI